MKTSFGKNMKFYFAFFLTGCFVFFNISCGLDTVYYIEGPSYVKDPPSYNSENAADWEFFFTTNEDNDYGDFNFQGTDVYYKIYSVYNDDSITTDAASEISVLNSLSQDSEKASTSFDKLYSTYKYKKLSVENDSGNVLVPYKGQNREISIRLNDSGSFSAHFDIKGTGGEITHVGKPLRSDGKRTFNFAGDGQYDKLPEKNTGGNGDDDVSYDKNLPDKKFYVVLYAVAVGNDIYWSSYYSNILYLGCVPIDVSSKISDD